MKKIIPHLLHLCVTDYCQLRCKHCYFGEHDRLKDMSVEECMMVTDKFFKLRDYFSNINGYNHIFSRISITGGEPLLNKSIIPIIKLISPRFNVVKFLTNGMIYNPKVCHTLLQYTNNLIYQISLDGTKEIHDNIRGEGTFDIVVSNIKKIRKDFPEMFIQISCNIHDKNYRDIINLAKVSKEIGVNRIFYDRYVKYWESGLNVLTRDEFDHFISDLKIANDLYTDNTFTVVTDRGMQIGDYSCRAGVGHQVCCANGDRYICSRYHVKSGNWFEDDIEILAKSAMYYEGLALQLPKKCYDCKRREACNGGMRCLSHSIYNRYDLEDIHCNKYEKDYNVL